MEAVSVAEGLRELADWVEANEEMLTPSDLSATQTLLICRVDKDEFIAAAHALGVEHSEVNNDRRYLNVTRRFGPIKVQVFIDASKVGAATERMRPTTEYQIDADVRSALGIKAVA